MEFTVGPGYYVTAGDFAITPEFVEKVKVRMQELVELKMPMIKKSYDLEEAMELFRECGMEDKEKLFHYRRSSFVNIYEMEGFYDYYYGFMLPNAGYVKYFDLIPYKKGMLLILPDAKEPAVVPGRPDRDMLLKLFPKRKRGIKR